MVSVNYKSLNQLRFVLLKCPFVSSESIDACKLGNQEVPSLNSVYDLPMIKGQAKNISSRYIFTINNGGVKRYHVDSSQLLSLFHIVYLAT